jgi:hypothetical protein
VIRENRAQDVKRFSDLYRRLSEKRVLKHPFELVYMLHTIGNDRNTEGSLLLNLNPDTDEKQPPPTVVGVKQDILTNGIASKSAFDAFQKYENSNELVFDSYKC